RRRWDGSRCTAAIATASADLTLTSSDGYILLTIEHECDRRSHAARLSSCNIEQLFALVGVVRAQTSITQPFENEIAGSRYGSAADAASALGAPLLFLSDHIPREQVGAGILRSNHRQSRCRWRGRRRWRCLSCANGGTDILYRSLRRRRPTAGTSPTG